MLLIFKRWLAAPVLSGDDQQTRLAPILDKLLTLGWAFQLLGIFIYPGTFNNRLTIALPAFIFMVLLQVLLHRGFFTFCNYGYLGFWWVFMTLFAFTGGGIYSTVSLCFAILVIWASISNGMRSGLLVWAACLLSEGAMLLTPIFFPGFTFTIHATPFAYWTIHAVLLLAVALAASYFNLRMSAALQQARQEINEHRQTQVDLLRYKEMTERARDTIVAVNPDNGQILYGNQAALKMYGYGPEEFLQLELADLRSEETRAELNQQIQQAFESGVLFETLHQRKNGQIFPVEVSSRRFDLNDSRILISIIRDISYRKQAEREMQTQHEFTSAVIDTVGSLMIVTDQQSRITLWNQACSQLTGYSAPEMIGHNIWDFLIPADEVEGVKQALTGLGENQNNNDHENHWLTSKGEKRLIAWTNTCLLDEAGQTKYIISVGQDVTEKRRMEEALAKSEALFRSVFEQAAVGVLIASSNFILLDFNQRLADMLGYKREELLGRDINDFSHPEDARRTQVDIQKLINQVEKKAIWIKRYIRKNGSILYTNLAVTLLCVENDTPQTLFAVMEDISQRMQVENELQEMNERLEERVRERTAELEQSNKELESFSYSISHDLRTPLRSMNGFAQSLRDDYGTLLPAEAHDYINRIVKSSRHMDQLINDLLTITHLGRKPFEPVNIDPAQIASEAWSDLNKENGQRAIQCAIENMPPCQADKRLLYQVYYNLLSNAAKFTRSVPNAQINVGSSYHGGKIVYWVHDNGIGFDMQYYNKLFGVFQRLHIDSGIEGTGIGLATVQRIIRRHQGLIWAEGTPGQGATFYFTLFSEIKTDR